MTDAYACENGDKIVGMASRSHMCKKCGYPMDEVFPGTWRCCECGFSEVETESKGGLTQEKEGRTGGR